jgi:pilus assembly protein CpaE
MQQSLRILVVGPDSRLQAEVAAALRSITDTNAILQYCPDFRQAIEALRSWRPEFTLLEMNKDLRGLKSFAEEAAACSPETTLAAAFSPEIFGPDVSESAIIIEAIRAGMQDFLRRPLSRADVEQLLDRLPRRSAASTTAPRGKIISFISNKGGVGKSTLAVNIGVGLARSRPDRVLLIDASLQLGVCASMLDVRPAATLTDAVRERNRLDETLLRQLAVQHESGLHLLAAPRDALEAAEIDDQAMARVLQLARRAYDYVLVDTFPMLDSVMMAVLDLSDRAFLVAESVVPTLLGMVSLLRVLDSLGFAKERQRIILNRYSNFAGNLKPDDVARRLGRAVDHIVPYQKKFLIAGNIGKPYILSATTWWGVGKALDQILTELTTIEAQSSPARNGAPRPMPSPPQLKTGGVKVAETANAGEET